MTPSRPPTWREFERFLAIDAWVEVRRTGHVFYDRKRVLTTAVKTKDGPLLTDDEFERLADEAQAGYDLSTWKPRRENPALATEPSGDRPP